MVYWAQRVGDSQLQRSAVRIQRAVRLCQQHVPWKYARISLGFWNNEQMRLWRQCVAVWKLAQTVTDSVEG
eukprot:3713182-Alexandrium_andersonii.AAC.1